MANVKISGLPAASTPLTGAELVPVVQSGVTSQTTLAAMPYVPSGTGAVTTTVQTKLRETVSVKDFGAVGDGVTNDAPAIQTAIIAAYNTGCNVYFPAGVYKINSTITISPTNINKQISLFGAGGQGIATLTGEGSTKIIGPTGAPAFTIQPEGSYLLQNGPTINNLYISSVDGTGTGFYIYGTSNVTFNQCTVYGYTNSSSHAWNFLTRNTILGGEQYCTLNNCRAILCYNCINLTGYNGTNIIGGLYQNYDSGTLSIQSGSSFITTNSTGATSDTISIIGAIVSFFDVACTFYGSSHRVDSVRFEGFNTAIKVYGTSCIVGNNCSFNNFIIYPSGNGLAVDIQSGALYTLVYPFNTNSLLPVPVRDSNTTPTAIRRDVIKVRQYLNNITAAGGTIIIPVEIPDRSVLPAYITFYNGGAALGTNYATRWTLYVSGRSDSGGYKESYADFPSANTIYKLWGQATNSTGTSINIGNIATITLVPQAGATTITNSYIEITYVPY